MPTLTTNIETELYNQAIIAAEKQKLNIDEVSIFKLLDSVAEYLASLDPPTVNRIITAWLIRGKTRKGT